MKRFLSILFFLCLINFVQAQDENARKEHFNLKKTVAISAYDPVSYFTGVPLKGSPNFIHLHNGIVYLFSSNKNKKSFIENPSKYEPAYGGWCAYAMGLKKVDKVAINPKTYKIIDNKLYLFYNKFGINTKEKWDKEGEKKLKTNADKNWNKIISK
ncbi:MAG: YHS domain protein [Flavobacteriales bacterium]|nr:YHS domain protein [Flavobacteriales bacterium]